MRLAAISSPGIQHSSIRAIVVVKILVEASYSKNPLVFAEQGGDFNSLNLGLGSTEDNGFSSTVCFKPRREVFAWLTQLWFNLMYVAPVFGLIFPSL